MKDLSVIIQAQRNTLKEYENLLDSIESNEDMKNLIYLEEKLQNLNTQVIELKEENNKLSDENLNLKFAASEHYMKEKVSLVKNSKKKVDMYFKDYEKKGIDRLSRLENLSKVKIEETHKFVDNKLTDSGVILREIDDFKLTIENKLAQLKNNILITNNNLLEEINIDYEELEKEKINDSIINKQSKRSNIETKIGLNVISKIGAILMLLGVLTLFRYTYTSWFNDYFKSAVGFLIGFVFLIGSEWFNKKEKNVFSVSLASIGIGVFYISIFNSYFALGVIPLSIALFLSLLVTLISVLLSMKYNSKTITIVSLIGGYLPLFSYGIYFDLTGIAVYVAMMYLLMLNISVLLIAMKKRWMSVNYTSFLLNLPTSIYLAFIAGNNYIVSLVYLLTVFALYVGIVISNPVINKLKLMKSEVILLGLNTIFNSLAVYALFDKLNWSDFNGALALIYALGYFVLGHYIRKKDDRKSSDLFYITAITFAALMIPLQFGISTMSFIMYRLEDTGISYIVNFTMLTSALIYVAYLNIDKINVEIKNIKETTTINLLKVYKYFVMFFVWGYVAKMIYYPFENVESLYKYSGLFDGLIITGITIALGYFYSSKYMSKNDSITKFISIFMYVVAIFITLNSTMSYYATDELNKTLVIVVLIIYNVIAFFGAKELLTVILDNRKINFEIYFLLLAIYVFGSTSIFINNQFNNSNSGLILNILYIILSFIYISYGFKEKKMLIRRFGLGLTFYALVKLFIFEFNYVSTLGQIFAYFTFGILLMSISYMYQKLEKSLKDGD